MTTPTPRTDKAIAEIWHNSYEYVLADFARQLERELAATKAQAETSQSNAELWREELTKADKRIQQLERELAEAKRVADNWNRDRQHLAEVLQETLAECEKVETKLFGMDKCLEASENRAHETLMQFKAERDKLRAAAINHLRFGTKMTADDLRATLATEEGK